MATNNENISIADSIGIALTTGKDMGVQVNAEMIHTYKFDNQIDNMASNYNTSIARNLGVQEHCTVNSEEYYAMAQNYISPKDMYESVDRAYNEMERDNGVSYMQSCSNPFDQAVFRIVRIKYITENAKPDSHLFDGIDTQYSGIGFYTSTLDDILDNLGNGTIEKIEIATMQNIYSKETLEQLEKNNPDKANEYLNASFFLYHYDNSSDNIYYKDILDTSYELRRDHNELMENIDVFDENGWFIDMTHPLGRSDRIEITYDKSALHKKRYTYIITKTWNQVVDNYFRLKDSFNFTNTFGDKNRQSDSVTGIDPFHRKIQGFNFPMLDFLDRIIHDYLDVPRVDDMDDYQSHEDNDDSSPTSGTDTTIEDVDSGAGQNGNGDIMGDNTGSPTGASGSDVTPEDVDSGAGLDGDGDTLDDDDDDSTPGSLIPGGIAPTKHDYDGAKDAVVPVYRDPLVLDLNGDGLDIRSKTDGAHFDLDKNGFAERTNWTTTDGFLCLDLNGNGKIDDGRELFGDSTELADGNAATGEAHYYEKMVTHISA